MPDYNEYAQRIVDAINKYGETVNLTTRKTTSYDVINGEQISTKTYRGYKVFIRPMEKRDWEQLPEGLKIKDMRKMYFTKPLPEKGLIVERILDGKDYEIVVPPDDNYFQGISFYYKCYIAVKEESNDPD